ncbi:MAG: cytochrome P450 [Caulobacteraceae bacterium]
MADGAVDILKDARAEAWATPLETLDMSLAERFRAYTFWPFFERLRAEAPVHWCPESEHGPYWSVTKYADIMTVETNHGVFSSEGGITVADEREDFKLPMFIAMDPPKHDAQRKAVSPIVAPHNLANLEVLIRERAQTIFDNLPIGETFDWVDRVSIELTTQMLATLFDFPWEDRRKLTRWSDVATATPETGIIESEEAGQAELMECAAYFTRLWNERVNAEPKNDLISMMAHAEATRNMGPEEFLGNLILLIVGGNDTTRNSISGGLLALNENPEEYRKVRENPALIPSMVSEMIRYQTPLAHMRRRALGDFQLRDKTIKAGDKVVMWYVSGNRDEEAIENPNAFIIDRPRPRQHLSFGFGIHRCVGNRLAEMQLRIVWEEILKRWDFVEVVGEPRRVLSSFIKGYETLPARIPG